MELNYQKYLKLPSPLNLLESPLLQKKQITLLLKRDDQIHPAISGNKWRKLKYNLIHAKTLGHNTLVSFGGTYSNHLAALAAAGRLFGFKTIGYVRGNEIDYTNPTIQFLIRNEMTLIPLSRTQFRTWNEPHFIQKIQDKHPNAYIIPLGGSNALALRGIGEMMDEIHSKITDYHFICTPIGSGGTAAGIMANTDKETLVFNTFKKDFTHDLIHPLIEKEYNFTTINDYHFGGFAKSKPALFQFIHSFQKQHGILLDKIYNGKMMYGLMDMIQRDYFEPNTKIIAIHTGGLQGNASSTFE